MSKSNNCENKTDEELVLLTLKDQDYYACLVQRYEDKIFRYIKRISSVPTEDVEDILQDVFISAYKNLNGFDHGFKFSSWLYHIAHNKTISFWRRMRLRPQVVTSEDDVELFLAVSAGDNLLEHIENKH
ncbi:MAG TPA: sigma-70 family RNA polymerase sigma factor, partial [Candidatus Pacebacteria bacterium]|nr:sigma-70 family RNA polymerase sigma factor [Candidatus Paceibacterota bacterium]